MSNVPNTSLHVFSNGETVTQDMLNQDVQVLQNAVNDNDQRISTLQQASIGQMSSFASGTAFPVSPAPVVGQVFYRTDIGPTGTLYVYDTTSNWNSDPSEIKRALGLGLTANPNVISTGDLNTYTTSGFFFVSGTVTNQPVAGVSGYLLVQVGNDTTRCSQTFTTDGTNITYRREFTGSAWSGWAKMISSADIGCLYGGTGNTSNASQSYQSGTQMLNATGLVTECPSNLFNYTDAWHFNVSKPGLYAFDLDVYRSDLPANQQMNIGVQLNNDSNKMYSEQMIAGQYGWNQSGGANLSKIPLHMSRAIRLNTGDYFNFYIITDDGPRSYWYWYRVMRISD